MAQCLLQTILLLFSEFLVREGVIDRNACLLELFEALPGCINRDGFLGQIFLKGSKMVCRPAVASNEADC